MNQAPKLGASPQPVHRRVKQMMAAALAESLFAPPEQLESAQPDPPVLEQQTETLPAGPMSPAVSAGAAITPLERPTAPGAADYSSLIQDPNKRSLPVADPARSGLINRLRLGGAAVQGLGAILGGEVGGYAAAAGGGLSEGAGTVAEMDRRALALEQDAYRQWLEGVTNSNRAVNMRQIDAGADAAQTVYQGERQDFMRNQDRADQLTDRTEGRVYEETIHQRGVRDEQTRDTREAQQERERDEREARQRREEQDRQFRQQLTRDQAGYQEARRARTESFQNSLRLQQAGGGSSRTRARTTDTAGAQAVIADLDEQIRSGATSLSRLRGQQPGMGTARAEHQTALTNAEKMLADLREERRERLSELNSVSNVGPDPGSSTPDGALGRHEDKISSMAERIRGHANPQQALQNVLNVFEQRRRDGSVPANEIDYSEHRLLQLLGY